MSNKFLLTSESNAATNPLEKDLDANGFSLCNVDLLKLSSLSGNTINMGAGSNVTPGYTFRLPDDPPGNSTFLQITNGTDSIWTTGGSGNVVGPGSATDESIAIYDGTTGELIKNSRMQVNTDAELSVDNNVVLSTHDANGNSNLSFGLGALVDAGLSGNSNMAMGNAALFANTSGDQNVAIGAGALSLNTIGNDNVALGFDALAVNIDGGNNIAIGQSALQSNISGDFNTALGNSSLRVNISGRNNVALGTFALENNIGGDSNLGIGANTLLSNTSGNENISLGDDSMVANHSGSNNIAIGDNALNLNTTGSNNICIGTSAGLFLTLDDNICIGNLGSGGPGIIRIGTSGTHTSTFLSGVFSASGLAASPEVVIMDNFGQMSSTDTVDSLISLTAQTVTGTTLVSSPIIKATNTFNLNFYLPSSGASYTLLFPDNSPSVDSIFEIASDGVISYTASSTLMTNPATANLNLTQFNINNIPILRNTNGNLAISTTSVLSLEQSGTGLFEILHSGASGDILIVNDNSSIILEASEAVDDAIDLIASSGGIDINSALNIALTAANIKQDGNIFIRQQEPIVFGDASQTPTTAQLLVGLLTSTITADVDWNLPAAATIVSDVSNARVDDAFDFAVINLSGTNGDEITIVGGTGSTEVGQMIVRGAGLATSASSAIFRLRITNIIAASEAYTVYRLG